VKCQKRCCTRNNNVSFIQRVKEIESPFMHIHSRSSLIFASHVLYTCLPVFLRILMNYRYWSGIRLTSLNIPHEIAYISMMYLQLLNFRVMYFFHESKREYIFNLKRDLHDLLKLTRIMKLQFFSQAVSAYFF